MKIGSIILTALAIALCLSWLGIVFYPSHQDFMNTNPYWNGLKEFSEKAHAEMINGLDDINPGENQVLISIPYTNFNENDLNIISGFVQGGGTLIVMDDYGFGNQILDVLGHDIEFNGKPLLDPYYCYLNEKLPVVTDISSAFQSASVNSITLNHATALNVTGKVEILARSSNLSFIDRNENLIYENDEEQGPFVVAARKPIGKGTVVAIADPSILINSMENKSDNGAFISNVINIAGIEPDIFVDTSHLPKKSLDHAKDYWRKAKDKMSNPYGLALLSGGILILSFLPLWRKGDSIDR